MQNAIWASTAELPQFPKLEENINTGILIVGGGMAGLLCAMELTRAGADCVLIEADRIAHGVTRNTTAKITSQHGLVYHKLLSKFGPEGARAYWEANERALKKYARLAQTVDCDFEQRDSIVYALDSDEALQKEMAALRKLQIPAEFLVSLDLPMAVAGGVCFRNQAQFHPLKFLSGIVGELRIYEHTAAREFMGNTVVTDRGKIHADKIVIATHFPILNKHGGYFLKMYQERSYVLALEGAQRLEGMYRDAASNGLSFRTYKDLLLIGGGGHRTGKKGTAWAEAEAFARKYYPQAKEKYRWSTQDCMTLDHMPYIGQYSPSTPEVYVAAGFNKWGMTTSMLAAGILRDQILGKENPDTELFSPSRSILHPQLLENVWESGCNLLRPTTPRCPHLGCALKWNSQEHSWDCPCHGSRFTVEGTLLDGPATGNLHQKKK